MPSRAQGPSLIRLVPPEGLCCVWVTASDVLCEGPMVSAASGRSDSVAHQNGLPQIPRESPNPSRLALLAEAVVRSAKDPYPRYREDEKWLVWGRGRRGRLVQVVFVLDPDDSIFIIHARLLTDSEARRYRKRSKR